MDTLREIIAFIREYIGPHWPFFVYTFGFAFVGEVMKRQVFTSKRLERWQGIRDELWNAGGAKRWALALPLLVIIAVPLPFHPVIASFVAAASGMPISSGLEETWGMRQLYIGGAAILSMGIYDLTHAVLKRKGLDFKLPGERHRGSVPPGDRSEDETPVVGKRKGGKRS